MPVRFESAMFHPTDIQVSYVEERDQGPKAQLVKTLVVDPEAVKEEVLEVFEALQALVDKGLLEARAPEESVHARVR